MFAKARKRGPETTPKRLLAQAIGTMDQAHGVTHIIDLGPGGGPGGSGKPPAPPFVRCKHLVLAVRQYRLCTADTVSVSVSAVQCPITAHCARLSCCHKLSCPTTRLPRTVSSPYPAFALPSRTHVAHSLPHWRPRASSGPPSFPPARVVLVPTRAARPVAGVGGSGQFAARLPRSLASAARFFPVSCSLRERVSGL